MTAETNQTLRVKRRLPRAGERGYDALGVSNVMLGVAAVAFIWPIVAALLGQPLFQGGSAWSVISMTGSFAALVSAICFRVQAWSAAGGARHPGLHQIWGVVVALLALVPGAVVTLIVASTLEQIT